MKPAPFAYLRAERASDAVAALAEHGERSRILAGGQSLMAVLNMRLATPELVIDISRTADLRAVSVANGMLEIGAAVTYSEVEERATLAREVPLLALALPYVAHVQIRNRGTLCGSIAHADPSAEMPLVLAALEGEVVLMSKRGERTLKAAAFQQGMLSTARAADELLRAVRFPLREAGVGYAFSEFAMRHGDFAIVAVAAIAKPGGFRLAVGGVADRPIVTDLLRHDGPLLERAALEAALNDLAWSLGARDDLHASAKLRRNLVRELGARTIELATRDADAAA
ncbi:MAG: FAD binding domain-containing protein [Burkholderiales bacterium]